jgi:class 3 adenylate cyclase
LIRINAPWFVASHRFSSLVWRNAAFRQANTPTPAMTEHRFEQPYPLLRFFLRFILPGLIFLLVISAWLTVVGARELAEGVYLEQATRRAQVIDRAMSEVAPNHWRRLKNGEAPNAIYGEPDGRRLLAGLNREVHELDLAHLKIYAANGVIQFSTDTGKIGTVDRSPAYVAASERGASSVVHRVDPDGSTLYELYVLVAVPGGAPVVFELYEPVDHLNALLWRAGVAAAGVPSLILIVLMLGMTRLVIMAQRDIDSRAALVADLHARLQRLLSGAASRAVHDAVSVGGRILSSRSRCTLLYSDIRDFTSFSEANEPERVVGFLNQSMAIMVDAITRVGGDVDKMIGDAVLARFQGEGAEVRALAAAREALRRLGQANLPRGVGIGIYTGEVISGTVGSADRMDFTVIGDSVNIAARLCSAAAQGEIVADTATVKAAGDEEFGNTENLSVKGRRSRLGVRRWRLLRAHPATG